MRAAVGASAVLRYVSQDMLLRTLDKGKPVERLGRKATGLRPERDRAAGLPGELSASLG